jgi:hypothetical protein
MKLIVLILTLVLAGGCREPSGGLTPESAPSQETLPSSEANKRTTVQFVAVVKEMAKFYAAGDHDTFSVEAGEPRFVLFLDVVSVEPLNYWFKAGSKADFAIHDPAKWFGTDRQEEIRGHSYQFVMVIAERLIQGMERRCTLTSVTRKNAEPRAGVDGEHAAAQP